MNNNVTHIFYDLNINIVKKIHMYKYNCIHVMSVYDARICVYKS